MRFAKDSKDLESKEKSELENPPLRVPYRGKNNFFDQIDDYMYHIRSSQDTIKDLLVFQVVYKYKENGKSKLYDPKGEISVLTQVSQSSTSPYASPMKGPGDSTDYYSYEYDYVILKRFDKEAIGYYYS